MAIETCPVCGADLPDGFPQSAVGAGQGAFQPGPTNQHASYPCPTCNVQITKSDDGVLSAIPNP